MTSELTEIGHLKTSTTAEVSREGGREGGVVLIKKFPVACDNNEVARQSKQDNCTQDNSFFKKSCPGWDSNPRHSAV